MRTSSTPRALRAALFALPLALGCALALGVLAGCDAADTGDAGTEAVSNQEAAVAIANGLALDGGGALDAVGGAVVPGDLATGPGGPMPGCDATRTYDETTQTWTRTIACERVSPDGAFFARYGRTQTLRFYGPDGTPQQSPQGADALDFAIVDGYGERRAPGLHHVLLDIGADFEVTGLQEELVTVNGTYERSATDTVRVRRPDRPGPAGQRTLIYDLDLTFDDVRGPRGDRGRWGHPVSGTLTGTIAGTATFTRPDGTTTTRTFERTFVIVFEENPAADVAYIRIGGERFRADLRTGAVEGAN